jgi:DNA-directed RNA polymerase specialized sigma24 family protein
MERHETPTPHNHVMGSRPAARDDPFEAFYTAHFQEIAAYVRRRVPPEDADDVTAQVFTVAWRRFGGVPDPPEDRLWLFGVARNCVADQQRSARRRHRLHVRLSAEVLAGGLAGGPAAGPGPGPLGEPVAAAISALRSRDREVLLLVLWDGLSQAEAATVLKCSPNAVEHRYRRARSAVRAALGAAYGADPGPAATPPPDARARRPHFAASED